MPSAVEESQKPMMDNLQERRAQAIAAKAQEIEKVLLLGWNAAQWRCLAVCLFKVSLASFKSALVSWLKIKSQNSWSVTLVQIGFKFPVNLLLVCLYTSVIITLHWY